MLVTQQCERGLQKQYRAENLENYHPQLAATRRLRLLRWSSSSPLLSPFVYNEDAERCAVLSTIDVPSRKRARKRTLALVNRPSLSETTMNCDPLNRVRKSCPMCCVCERSKAASISSRIYMGAGLNCRSAMIRESAIRDLHHCQTKNIWALRQSRFR